MLITLILTLGLATAMTVNSVEADNFSLGEEQTITLEIKNTLDENVKDVSLEINTSNLPFTLISSEDIDDIDEDDTESVEIKLKAMNGAQAGDYSIQYKLTYTEEGAVEESSKSGTFVLTIEANPELAYTINTEKPIVGSQGKVKLTIINKGLGDAKFVSVKIVPQGYTLLSAPEDYIGTIGSDDFETVNLDVIFDEKNPFLNANIEYRDFNNNKITKNINLPIKVYSREEALKLGIIKQNNTVLYTTLIIVGIVIFFVVRKIRKKRKKSKLQEK
jgi:hypothetical protein